MYVSVCRAAVCVPLRSLCVRQLSACPTAFRLAVPLCRRHPDPSVVCVRSVSELLDVISKPPLSDVIDHVVVYGGAVTFRVSFAASLDAYSR